MSLQTAVHPRTTPYAKFCARLHYAGNFAEYANYCSGEKQSKNWLIHQISASPGMGHRLAYPPHGNLCDQKNLLRDIFFRQYDLLWQI